MADPLMLGRSDVLSATWPPMGRNCKQKITRAIETVLAAALTTSFMQEPHRVHLYHGTVKHSASGPQDRGTSIRTCLSRVQRCSSLVQVRFFFSGDGKSNKLLSNIHAVQGECCGLEVAYQVEVQAVVHPVGSAR